ncbi:Homeobox-like_domain superfamily [Hexamita inflata]|uniref:Homeobox-like domain superfamily n=1 Tax=Hexamita inflata TaxID=28002 RepID=A0AA86PGG4_9EUKA|nr:Homeobox-like domain superfamily [Hexamita inflata]
MTLVTLSNQHKFLITQFLQNSKRKYHMWTQNETVLVFKAVQRTNKNWRLVQKMFPQISLPIIRNKQLLKSKCSRISNSVKIKLKQKRITENDTTLLNKWTE